MIPTTSFNQQQQHQYQSPTSSVYSGNSGSHNANNNNYQTALVPATGPGTTAYNNYDLIDLGYGSTPASATSRSPAPATTGDLLSFDNDDSVPAFATPPAQASTTAPVVHDTKALEARDEAFVKSLSPEIIEEQKRIMAQIQERNANTRAVAISESATERYNVSYDNAIDVYSPPAEGTPATLPAEVHPAKYQMKEVRKVKTAAGATTGAVIGGIMFGPAWPIGVAAGAAAGGYATKVAARSGERRQQRKWESKNFNEYTARGVASVQSESVSFA